MIIGTAGHIDHGKTALVKALTGIDADRLAEEKSRGITIDLGYAYWPLPTGAVLGFVDVPGHEKFVHNMLAGATGIAFALLVVAADEGPKPQTLEHLQILDLLGVTRGAVAITKTDRVDAARAAEVAAQVEALVRETTLAASPIFPLSALSGVGVAELRDYLARVAAEFQTPVARGGFRLAVDRSFTLAGAGTVVTGTVFAGQTQVGERLQIGPAGRSVRVRAIHAQNRPAEFARFGQRCALNLADVAKSDVQRGDWLLTPGLCRPTQRLDVRLRLLRSAPRPLRSGTAVHMHLGAARASARVILLLDQPLEPGASALAQLVLDRPTCACWNDRVVLRDASALRTIAGGCVLDAQPPARGRRSEMRLNVLAAWEQPALERALTALLDASPFGVDLDEFGAKANCPAEYIQALCERLDVQPVMADKPLGFTPTSWSRLGDECLAALGHEHAVAPDSLGLNAEQLRLRVAPRLARAAFAAVLAELLAAGRCARDGSWWHLPDQKIVLGDDEAVLWAQLAPMLVQQPFQPPRVRDIARVAGADEGLVRRLFLRAARLGWVYKVAHDHYFDRSAVVELAAIVRELAGVAVDGAVTAAAFRDRIGTGRKLAIQILEYFDRVGLTRRVNDTHRLRQAAVEF